MEIEECIELFLEKVTPVSERERVHIAVGEAVSKGSVVKIWCMKMLL